MNDRRHYYEQPCIIEQRHTHLHEENRPVVYLDETWANPHDGKDCAWVERDDVTAGTLDDGLDEERDDVTAGTLDDGLDEERDDVTAGTLDDGLDEERDDVTAGTLDDGLDEELVDEFIIQVGGDSDESDDSDQSDSSDDE